MLPRARLLILIFALGCNRGAEILQPSGKAAQSVEMSPTQFAIVERRCLPCHDHGQASPAGIDLSTPTSLRSDQLAAWRRGLLFELAPFYAGMPDGERRDLLNLAGAARAVRIPARFRWSMAEALQARAPGTSASTPGLGFGIVVEDMWMEGVDGASAWTVEAVGGESALGLYQTHQPPGEQPSSYWAPTLPWHGRLRNAKVTGSVQHGRWTSIVLGVQELIGPTRDRREYVRLQIDRDFISLRSTPTDQEIAPWYQDPDHALTGTLDASGFYIPNSEVLRFEFTRTLQRTNTLYRAKVWRASGALVADLTALDSRPPKPGGFAFHKYGLSGSSAARWIGVVVEGDLAGSPASPVEVVP